MLGVPWVVPTFAAAGDTTVRSRLERAVMPPMFDGPRLTDTAALLHWMIVAVAVVVTIGPVFGARYGSALLFRHLAIALVVDALAGLLLTGVHFGYVRASAVLFLGACWLIMTSVAWTAGGVSAPVISAQLALVVAAALLLGWRSGIGATFIVAATVFFMAWAETTGLMPVSSVAQTPFSRAYVLLEYAVIIAALVGVASHTLRAALTRAQAEVAERKAAEAALNESRDGLEQRVHDRTSDLELAFHQLATVVLA
jgi:hypothetical protein